MYLSVSPVPMTAKPFTHFTELLGFLIGLLLMMLARGIDDLDKVDSKFCATSCIPIMLSSTDLSSVSWVP